MPAIVCSRIVVRSAVFIVVTTLLLQTAAPFTRRSHCSLDYGFDFASSRRPSASVR